MSKCILYVRNHLKSFPEKHHSYLPDAFCIGLTTLIPQLIVNKIKRGL